MFDRLERKGLLRLRALDLEQNGFGPEGARALTTLLGKAFLTECKLRDNKLGVEGWTIIFNALRDSPTSKITTWDLSDEGLGPEIAKPLAEYLSVTGSLTSVWSPAHEARAPMCSAYAFAPVAYVCMCAYLPCTAQSAQQQYWARRGEGIGSQFGC